MHITGNIYKIIWKRRWATDGEKSNITRPIFIKNKKFYQGLLSKIKLFSKCNKEIISLDETAFNCN